MSVAERLAALQMEAEALVSTLRAASQRAEEAGDNARGCRLDLLLVRAIDRAERRLNAEGEYWDSVMEYLP